MISDTSIPMNSPTPVSNPMTPTRLEKLSTTEMRIAWNTGEEFALPFVELRFNCPCASCVDEHTGERTIKRGSIKPDIRPDSLQVVGRYAVQIVWTDRHGTGMYHFDRLHELCRKHGRKLEPVRA